LFSVVREFGNLSRVESIRDFSDNGRRGQPAGKRSVANLLRFWPGVAVRLRELTYAGPNLDTTTIGKS
jgi:hypothetical protein